ncbi:zinc finger protein 408-like [Patiria miniata]|uniref:Uncharacterized protein n=1 Tax=Patiria miniata TaxID=46514 RepID=A0A914AJ84_PATMI|nr:zinc finger protein 408-like [Patiria miniata]XP_038063782.1 zinc finger protein 408-like [Patiria miniata]
MRFIENPDLREWVKNSLRRAVFQKAHELAVQTGCEVMVKLQDSTSYSSQYYATQTLHLQYQGKGLCKQPWDIKVSGLTGLPEAVLVERGCQIGGKENVKADLRVKEEIDVAESSMQDQEPKQAGSFERASGILSADSDSQMDCEKRVDSCPPDYRADKHDTSQAASRSFIQPDRDSKSNVPYERNEPIPGGSGPGESYASYEAQPNAGLGFEDKDGAVPTSTDLFRTAATYSIGFPINKFQAQTKSVNARTIFPGQVLDDLEAQNAAPAVMQNAGGADDADKPALKPYQCGICRKTFGSIQFLSRHGQVNHGLDKRMSFSCDVCGQSYKIAKHLQRHMRMHHSVMPYICPICNKGFFNGTSLTKHVKVHEQLNEGNQFLAAQGSRTSSQDFSPPEMSTSENQQPEGHVTEDTTDKIPGEAVELGDYPANIPSLPGPSRTIPIFPQNAQNHGEDQCDTKHPSSSEEQNQDGEGRSHQMSWQDASLASDDSNRNTSDSSAAVTQGGIQQITYIRNLGLFSTGHLCHLCGKSYKYSSTFKEHLLTHSSVPRFTCKICGEPFTRQRQFRDHMIHHTGTYPYHCVVCGKGFIRPSIMKKHQCVEQFQ